MYTKGILSTVVRCTKIHEWAFYGCRSSRLSSVSLSFHLMTLYTNSKIHSTYFILRCKSVVRFSYQPAFFFIPITWNFFCWDNIECETKNICINFVYLEKKIEFVSLLLAINYSRDRVEWSWIQTRRHIFFLLRVGTEKMTGWSRVDVFVFIVNVIYRSVG